MLDGKNLNYERCDSRTRHDGSLLSDCTGKLPSWLSFQKNRSISTRRIEDERKAKTCYVTGLGGII